MRICANKTAAPAGGCAAICRRRFASALMALKHGLARVSKAPAEYDGDADAERIAILSKYPF